MWEESYEWWCGTFCAREKSAIATILKNDLPFFLVVTAQTLYKCFTVIIYIYIYNLYSIYYIYILLQNLHLEIAEYKNISFIFYIVYKWYLKSLQALLCRQK